MPVAGRWRRRRETRLGFSLPVTGGVARIACSPAVSRYRRAAQTRRAILAGLLASACISVASAQVAEPREILVLDLNYEGTEVLALRHIEVGAESARVWTHIEGLPDDPPTDWQLSRNGSQLVLSRGAARILLNLTSSRGVRWIEGRPWRIPLLWLPAPRPPSSWRGGSAMTP